MLSGICVRRTPFRHGFKDDFLDVDQAKALRSYLLALPADQFDAYDNPFEKKLTLRDKKGVEGPLKAFFDLWDSDEFRSEICAAAAVRGATIDATRHYHGLHIYERGGALDCHLDAAVHPKNGLAKRITVLLYLSTDEMEGGNLEIWNKERTECHTVPAKFNRLVFFCDGPHAYHGVSSMSAVKDGEKRLVLLCSFMTKRPDAYYSDRTRALFMPVAGEAEDVAKDEMREKRASEAGVRDMYRTTPTGDNPDTM